MPRNSSGRRHKGRAWPSASNSSTITRLLPADRRPATRPTSASGICRWQTGVRSSSVRARRATSTVGRSGSTGMSQRARLSVSTVARSDSADFGLPGKPARSARTLMACPGVTYAGLRAAAPSADSRSFFQGMVTSTPLASERAAREEPVVLVYGRKTRSCESPARPFRSIAVRAAVDEHPVHDPAARVGKPLEVVVQHPQVVDRQEDVRDDLSPTVPADEPGKRAPRDGRQLAAVGRERDGLGRADIEHTRGDARLLRPGDRLGALLAPAGDRLVHAGGRSNQATILPERVPHTRIVPFPPPRPDAPSREKAMRLPGRNARVGRVAVCSRPAGLDVPNLDKVGEAPSNEQVLLRKEGDLLNDLCPARRGFPGPDFPSRTTRRGRPPPRLVAVLVRGGEVPPFGAQCRPRVPVVVALQGPHLAGLLERPDLAANDEHGATQGRRWSGNRALRCGFAARRRAAARHPWRVRACATAGTSNPGSDDAGGSGVASGGDGVSDGEFDDSTAVVPPSPPTRKVAPPNRKPAWFNAALASARRRPLRPWIGGR